VRFCPEGVGLKSGAKLEGRQRAVLKKSDEFSSGVWDREIACGTIDRE
jgi:hypothetical protein